LFDPPPELLRISSEAPLSRLRYPDGHLGWLVTSHELASRVLAGPAFSARMDLGRRPVERPADMFMRHPAPPGIFVGMDPPDHTRYRRLLAGHFTLRRIERLRPRIEEIVSDRIEAVAEHGAPVDLVTEFALPIPSMVISELLGVPYERRSRFQDTTAVLVSLSATPEQGRAALDDLMDLLQEMVVGKRRAPTDDLLGDLARTTDLADDELAGIGSLLLFAGHETTANMLALGAFALLQHPDQLAALRRDDGLAANAVEELLRYLTIVQFGVTRTALREVELDGTIIGAGETVTVSLSAANRDPDKFSAADRLELGRDARRHLAFGYGVHQCLGQHLARLEMRIGYSALFRRFGSLRLAVEPDAVPMRSDMNFYGVHELPVAW